MANKTLLTAIDDALRAYGFVRKKKHWYRQEAETTLVIGIRKSDWGNQYFVDLGVWLRELQHVDYPQAEDCHIGVRLNAIVQEPEALEHALDLEEFSIADEDRPEIIIHALTNAGVPYLHEWDTKKRICKRLRSNDLSFEGRGYAAVLKVVYDLCGLDVPT
jgi:hypothetical protein